MFYYLKMPKLIFNIILGIFLSVDYSTVTDFAKFLGLSTSVPRASAAW